MASFSLTSHLARSWLELPFLVDQFVQRVAPALRCSRFKLRNIICADLGLEEYESLGAVCRMMGDVYELLVNAHSDVDVEHDYLDAELTALAAAVVRSWREGDEQMSALQEIDPGAIDPIRRLPWRIWATWSNREDGSSQTGAAIARGDEDARKEDAYEVLDEFMDSCREWRQEILNSYTLVHEGTPVGLSALDAAAALVEQCSSVQDAEFENRLGSVLVARGFYGAGALMDGLLRQSLERTVSTAKLQLDGWRRKRHQALIDRVEGGERLIQVRELRAHFRWLTPELVDGAYEDGPCMWEVLARVNDDAYVEVTHVEQAAETVSTICPFATVYVEREEEIAGTLRCTGAGGTGMHIVGRDKALEEGVPQIAGWYAIRWWD